MQINPGELTPRAHHLLVRLEKIRASHEFVHGGVPERGHVSSEILSEEEEKVDNVVLVSGKFSAELGILRGDAHGARVLVALAHHDASHGHERGGGEPPLLGAEQCGDEKVTSRLELAVRLQHGATAQVVRHQRLLRPRQAQLPRQTRGLDPGPSARARAAIVSGD